MDRVPGPAEFSLRIHVIHRVVFILLVPGVILTRNVIKEVAPNLLLSLILMNLVHLDNILYPSLLGLGPVIGLEDILRERSLIAIGLILEIPINGDIKKKRSKSRSTSGQRVRHHHARGRKLSRSGDKRRRSSRSPFSL